MATSRAGLPVNQTGDRTPDRRRAARYKLELPATVEGTNIAGLPFREDSVLIDLSSRGASLRLVTALQPGARLIVSIRLSFASAIWMQYCATVVRVERPGGAGCVGLEFQCLGPRFVRR